MASLRVRTMTILLALALFCSEMAAVEKFYSICSGDSLDTNDSLQNPPYRFIMQADCDLVLYYDERVGKPRRLWNSETSGKGTSCEATLQKDGSLVIQSGSSVVWKSIPAAGPSTYCLVLDLGDVVIYDIYGKPSWYLG